MHDKSLNLLLRCSTITVCAVRYCSWRIDASRKQKAASVWWSRHGLQKWPEIRTCHQIVGHSRLASCTLRNACLPLVARVDAH